MIGLALAALLSVSPLACPPGTAPGWLDEGGQPTSCVANGPAPEVTTPASTPAPSTSSTADPTAVVLPALPTADPAQRAAMATAPVVGRPARLASTGVPVGPYAAAAVVSIAAGGGLLQLRRRAVR